MTPDPAGKMRMGRSVSFLDRTHVGGVVVVVVVVVVFVVMVVVLLLLPLLDEGESETDTVATGMVVLLVASSVVEAIVSRMVDEM
jgi:quinol-cytochrome oxidoreductase complex cytochrome b subunit